MASNTSTKVATITGAAKDDSFSALLSGLSEDRGLASFNVLGNDPGSAKLYSLAQSAAGATSYPVAATGTSVLGAKLSINADGTIAYDASTVDLQYLSANQTVTDTFVYTVQMANGAVSTASVTVELAGQNDGPVITSASADALGEVKEDDQLSAAGQLSASDADQGATQAWSIVGDANGAYGSLSLDATGGWTYLLDNAAHQSLTGGETHTETFVVRVADDQGSFADQQVNVTVTGTNDAAVIDGDKSGAVTEDSVLTVSGKLAVADADAGESSFQALSGLAGAYGTLGIDAEGNWTYLLDNSLAAVQELNDGQSLQDSINVFSVDGTAQAISITINGTNDKPALETGPAFTATALSGAWQWGFTDWNALYPFGNMDNVAALSEVTRILTNGYSYAPQGGSQYSLVNGIYNYPGPVNSLELSFTDGPTLVTTFDFVSSRSYASYTDIKVEGRDATTGTWSVLGDTTAGQLGITTGAAHAYEMDITDAVVSAVRVTLTGSQVSLHEVSFNEPLGYLV